MTSTSDPAAPSSLPQGSPRHRARWIVLGVVVLVAVLLVVAEFVVRGIVDRTIAQQVKQSLPSGSSGTITARASGIIIPQLVGGKLSDVEISSKRIVVEGIPLSADVSAHDIPLSGHGSAHRVDGTVSLAADGVASLSKYSALFGNLTLRDGGVSVAGKTSVLGYSISYSAAASVAAQQSGTGVTITPETVKIGSNSLGVDVSSLPGVLNKPISVCTAQFLPKAVRIRSVDVTQKRATVRVHASSLPLSEKGLRTTGSCS